MHGIPGVAAAEPPSGLVYVDSGSYQGRDMLNVSV